MISLAQARVMLDRYKGQNNDFTERVNLVTERLDKAGNWRSTKDTVVFQVHADEFRNAFITLPQQYNTILAGVYLNSRNQDASELRLCGYPFQVRDEYYSFMTDGPGFSRDGRYNWGFGFIPEIDRFTTFRNWYTAKFLRFKFATAEANGGIINVRGKLNGQDIYTGAGANMIEGENLTIAGATTLTTTKQFDEIPYSLVKPITYGPVSMYTWDGVTETLVARYDPRETVPQWRRYRVPACSDWTESEPGQCLTVCKREWMVIGNDNDPVVPGNIGALKFGLQALLKEDAQDFVRADELWNMAFKLLANEAQDDTGAGTAMPASVVDSFGMAVMDNGWGGGYNQGWGN